MLFINKLRKIFNINYFKIALRKFTTTKNILTLIIIFIIGLLIRLCFKSIDVKIGCFESDLIFCLSSLTSISIASFIRKYLELIEIPEIKWPLFIQNAYCQDKDKDSLTIIKDPKPICQMTNEEYFENWDILSNKEKIAKLMK